MPKVIQISSLIALSRSGTHLALKALRSFSRIKIDEVFQRSCNHSLEFNSRCGIQTIDSGSGGRLRNSVVSYFSKQKVNFPTEENGKTRKVKPQV